MFAMLVARKHTRWRLARHAITAAEAQKVDAVAFRMPAATHIWRNS
jgi:hypothetical protein